MSEIKEGQVWHCPNCGGHGTLADAVVSFGPGGVTTYKPASTCWLCRGKGIVLVQPLPDAGAKETVGERPDAPGHALGEDGKR